MLSASPYSKSQIIISNGNYTCYDVRCFALGYQQWGKKAQGASNTVSFPISFSTIYSLTTCVWANQALGGDYGTAGSVSTKSFVTFCGEPLGWIATGK